MDKIVLVTGGFDPLHSGHIEFFKSARKLGDKLIVGINSDEWLVRKKGRAFMPFDERVKIIKELAIVDQVIGFEDKDNTACQAIFHTLCTQTGKIIFANGGDRTEQNIPEIKIYGDQSNVEFVFGVGGKDKKNSSSELLNNYSSNHTIRDWGHWRVLTTLKNKKIKELVIQPGHSLSMQKHTFRSEQWIVYEGLVDMTTEHNGLVDTVQLTNNSKPYTIEKGVWHKAVNNSKDPAYIIEIQEGEKCIEEDIERRI